MSRRLRAGLKMESASAQVIYRRIDAKSPSDTIPTGVIRITTGAAALMALIIGPRFYGVVILTQITFGIIRHRVIGSFPSALH